MKRRVFYIFIINIILVFSIKSYAVDETTLKEQQDTFGISNFIKNSKEYINDELFEENEINQILDTALEGKINNNTFLTKIFGIFGKEVKNTLSTLGSILVIVVIHSILKSISESLENESIAKLIYYVQYILIVTIIMKDFSNIVVMVKEATNNMVGFINILIPLLTSLMLFTGSITTTSIIEPAILFSVNLIGNLIQNVLIPIMFIITSFSVISKISDKIQIERISKFMKSGVVWFLGIVLTAFVAVVSLEGTLSSSVDGITAKTTKAVVSSTIPIVGKILGDAVDSVLGCGVILKNAVGIVGVIIILGICIAPILKLTLITISYKILARTV